MAIKYDRFDEAEFLKVARMVLKFNKHAAGYQPVDIVARMKREAERLDNDQLGYTATGGWMVSAYFNEDGTVGIKPSLAAHIFDDDGEG